MSVSLSGDDLELKMEIIEAAISPLVFVVLWVFERVPPSVGIGANDAASRTHPVSTFFFRTVPI